MGNWSVDCVWDGSFDWNWVWGWYMDWVWFVDWVRYCMWHGNGNVVSYWHWVRGGHRLGMSVDDVHFLGDWNDGAGCRCGSSSGSRVS